MFTSTFRRNVFFPCLLQLFGEMCCFYFKIRLFGEMCFFHVYSDFSEKYVTSILTPTFRRNAFFPCLLRLFGEMCFFPRLLRLFGEMCCFHFYFDFSEKCFALIFKVTKCRKWILQCSVAAAENIQLHRGKVLRREQINARCTV
jgi:hypothetical protein